MLAQCPAKAQHIAMSKPPRQPEIIPPDHTERIYIARLGPLGSILLILVIGLLSAVLLLSC
jgi:hypothetical protein